MKRLNPSTGLPFLRGATRKDGFIFLCYRKSRIRQDGTYAEDWYSPECFKKVNRKHDVKVKERYLKRKTLLDGIKMKAGCKVCGYKAHPCALDFDHINPTDKVFEVSRGKTRSMDTLMTEVDKCDVLCANCHRIKSYEEKDYAKSS